MRFTIFFVLSLFFSLALFAQNKLNLPLKARLDSIYDMDQKYRHLLMLKNQGRGDSLAKAFGVPISDLESHIWKMIGEADSKNLPAIEKILKQYGYPGRSLVGTPTNMAAYFVLQHADKSHIEKHIAIIEKAAIENEIPFTLYAMMLDRLLMYQDKEQIYGTQISGVRTFDLNGFPTEMKMFVWPIRDPENVNKKRREAGFDLTVEENAKRLGTEYKVVSLEAGMKMRGK